MDAFLTFWQRDLRARADWPVDELVCWFRHRGVYLTAATIERWLTQIGGGK